MNLQIENLRNLLFVVKDTGYDQNIYELCLECVKKEATVLFITRKSFNLLPLISKLSPLKEQLKKFIIMYFDRIEEIVKKLLELHDWTLLPLLVVIDLQVYLEHYVRQPNEDLELAEAPAPMPALQSICLCIATLFNYMSSVARRLLELKSDDIGTAVAHSMVLLGTHADVLSQSQLELLINLYFYDETAYDDYDEIKSKIIATFY